MKKRLNLNILIYFFIVLLPTIVGVTYSINGTIKEHSKERIDDAKWIASIHESHWNQFINETITSIEILSLAAESVVDNPNEMNPLLQRAHLTDPRYGGLYILNKDGFVITGSNDFLQNQDPSEREYIKEIAQTKDIVISDKYYVLDNGQKVIGLASPILNENKNLIGITVALLRIDYVENIMNVLTPDSEILIINGNKEILMNFNTNENERINNDSWISYPIASLPWDIKVKIADAKPFDFIEETMIALASFLIITHILFLLIKYMILRRQAAQEKKENESQKLKLVGTLAASTAHEIRNPLTGIKGLVQLLSEKYKDPNDQFYFSVINQEINRINEIIGEFLILGKPSVQKTKIEDLRVILRELLPLISSEAKLKNVNWTISLPSNPISVICAKDQMKQVILNITRNAFEAMEEGGNLHIELKEKSNHTELLIVDTGFGIPKEDIEKIFDPFYTSKESGTGLGLVVCNRILESFGGEIHIKSKERKGTTVIITLPIVKQS